MACRIPRAIPLVAFAAVAIGANACSALIGRPEPFAGRLGIGQVVRAIVEEGSPPFAKLVATRRVSRDRHEIEQVSFSRHPNFQPAEGGTMVVLRVVSSWNYHTPDDAAGMHEWLTVYDSQLVAIEMSETEAIAAARACLEGTPGTASLDREDPFAFGPGPAGGWIVRFDPVAPQTEPARGVELEVDRSGHCTVSSPAPPRPATTQT